MASVATPEPFKTPDPMVLALSLKVTDPVGVPPVPVTVAVKVTVLPYVEGLPSVARLVIEPASATLNWPAPAKWASSIWVAPEPVAPQVPASWKVAPPSNERARMLLTPAKLRLTGRVPEPRTRLAEEPMAPTASSWRVAPLATLTLFVPRLPAAAASRRPALTVVVPA